MTVFPQYQQSVLGLENVKYSPFPSNSSVVHIIIGDR